MSIVKYPPRLDVASSVRFSFRLMQAVALSQAFAHVAFSQQTIVNVPSDALTPRGEHFYLHETQLAPVASTSGGFATTNFYTYGLTETTELCATLYNVDAAGSEDLTLGLGFKSVFEVLPDRAPHLEIKYTIGHMVPVSLGPSSQAVGYFTYTHSSFRIPGTDLRLLGGVAFGSKNLFGEETVSALGGVEFPLTDHLSFTGEWFSGTHNLSGLIPGLTYHNRNLIIVGGFKIPNDFNPDNYGLVLEAGFFFGPGASAHRAAGEREDSYNHYGMHRPTVGTNY